jgi:hypothetical protein
MVSDHRGAWHLYAVRSSSIAAVDVNDMLQNAHRFLCTSLLLSFSVAFGGDKAYPMLAPEDGRALAMAVLTESGADKLSSFSLETEKDSAKVYDGFYLFGAMWAGEPEGSVIIGYYAVDKRTGDVWEATACNEYSFPALKRLQDAVRRRAGMGESDYRRLRRKGPYC